MIDNRRPGSSWLLFLLLGMIVILSGTLALRWEILFPPDSAAAQPAFTVRLPTAAVRAADAPAQVAVKPGAAIAVADSVNLPAAPAVAAPTVLPATPAPEILPTPTITPVPLGEVGAPSQPIPTLMPTPADAPAAQPGTAAGAPVAVPILMYHYIRTVDPNADPMGYNLSITPEEFEQEIGWLQAQGYTAVTMATVQACLRGEGCPANPVALTFDDGYEDAFTNALPTLQRHGMTGTFYIVNTFVGQPGYMSWEQIAQLRDAGMEIGAHSVSHLNLTTLDQAMATDEIARSKGELDARLGINVTSFCYPAGFYDGNIEGIVQAAGYSNATTTRWDGDYSDLLALPRRRVAGGTSLDGFAGIVAGG